MQKDTQTLSNEDQAVLKKLEAIQDLARKRGLMPDQQEEISAPTIEQTNGNPYGGNRTLPEIPTPTADKISEELNVLPNTSEAEAAYTKLEQSGFTNTVPVRMLEPNGPMTARISQWYEKMQAQGFEGNEITNTDMGRLFNDPELKSLTDALIIDSMSMPSYISCLAALVMAFGKQSIEELKHMKGMQ